MEKEKAMAKLILQRLSKKYGNPHTQLKHKNMFELFVSVFLSPQCTDKQVNRCTSLLFKEFRSFRDIANSDPKALENSIRMINYYKTKARNLRNSAKMIMRDFNGAVPRSIKELVLLPGVGRKVANVILNEGYGINEGIAVDTHCGRVAVRLGLSKSKDPKKIESDLMLKVPKNMLGKTSNLFIELGRDVCTSRNRKCDKCVLKDICPSSTLKLGSKDLYRV